VAYLNGHQNKKRKLEEYYQVYETTFDNAAAVRTAFLTILNEIRSLLPGLRGTRWRKKSDFYSLFLCFSEFSESLPWSAEVRIKVASALIKFSDDVDQQGDVLHNITPVDDNVRQYAYSVEKAASDLGNRLKRHTVLKAIISDAVG
jgi:hypothetical protein